MSEWTHSRSQCSTVGIWHGAAPRSRHNCPLPCQWYWAEPRAPTQSLKADGRDVLTSTSRGHLPDLRLAVPQTFKKQVYSQELQPHAYFLNFSRILLEVVAGELEAPLLICRPCSQQRSQELPAAHAPHHKHWHVGAVKIMPTTGLQPCFLKLPRHSDPDSVKRFSGFRLPH